MRRPCSRSPRPSALAGCEIYQPASPDAIARARYVSPEPPSVTLMSMVNAKSGRSAHAGLLINGSQQVLYDPAGTFTHPDLPRRGDIHYGMTPRFVDYYERYHARFDYFVEAQKVPVSRAAADQLIANAQARGPEHEDDLRAGRRRRAAAGAAVPGRRQELSSPRRCATISRGSRGRGQLRLRERHRQEQAPGSAATTPRS